MPSLINANLLLLQLLTETQIKLKQQTTNNNLAFNFRSEIRAKSVQLKFVVNAASVSF